MFLHYLVKVNSSNLLQITIEKIRKRVVFDKNERFMLSCGWMDTGVLFPLANARSVCPLPAHMHEDSCAIRQLHCQWCSGRRYATLAANVVSVRQCRAPATGTLAVERHTRSCNQPDLGQGCSLAKDPVEWTPALPTREVAQCRVPVSWGVVLLKDEEFRWYLALTGSSCFDRSTSR